MILGDNLFYGNGLTKRLEMAVENADNGKATIFGYHVHDPERFGIVELDDNGKAISVEEKPKNPKSNYCITGLYFYDNSVVEVAKNVKPSLRGELEITSVNKEYLDEGKLNVITLGRGFTWLDTGTHESLVDAANFVKMTSEHQNLLISCPEEIGFKRGWISKEALIKQGELLSKNGYGKHLLSVAHDEIKY